MGPGVEADGPGQPVHSRYLVPDEVYALLALGHLHALIGQRQSVSSLPALQRLAPLPDGEKVAEKIGRRYAQAYRQQHATPILLPIATQYCGLDPVQFGIMVVLNCGIGLLTPPVGAVLFIGSAVGKTPMERVVKATMPFYICMIVTLLLISFIPDISLLLPKVLGGYVPVFGH